MPTASQLFQGLTLARVAWTTFLAACATGVVILFFDNTYLDFLVSALCVAYTTMLLFTIAGNLAWRWLPREAAQMIAVVLGSGIGTVLTSIVKGRDLFHVFTERWWSVLATLSLGIGFGCVVVGIYIYREQRARAQTEVARADAAEQRLEKQALTAQLQLLQAQVEPHFLFNTLANVQHLTATDPAMAGRMLDSLIRYLRAALPQMREQTTTLRRELEMVRAYLEIQAIRMGHRLRFTITVPETLLSLSFPPVMLISLVENAVKHGIDPMPEGGCITVSAVETPLGVRVSVSDTGAGLAEHMAMGVGLSNIRERLATLYGRAARLDLLENTPRGVIATLEVPCDAPAIAVATPLAATSMS